MGDQKVAGYFRVSQARDDMKAPQMYTDEIERYCRYRDLALGEIFSDIDYSGYHRSEISHRTAGRNPTALSWTCNLRTPTFKLAEDRARSMVLKTNR
jgi:hypothetical protein